MDPFSAAIVLFGCLAVFIIVGICFAIFSALFGRRRWSYGMYRPRPFFPWLFWDRPYERREFFEPRYHHHHHHGGGFGGGGVFGGGEHFGTHHSGGHHHHGGGFGGGGHHGGHH